MTLLFAGLFVLGLYTVVYSFDLLGRSLASLPISDFSDGLKDFVGRVEHGNLSVVTIITLVLLALLGLLNSLACDWWARRFVDRHVTAPVVNSLRLPEWSVDERAMVARHVDLCFRRVRADHLHLFPGWTRLPRDAGPGE